MPRTRIDNKPDIKEELSQILTDYEQDFSKYTLNGITYKELQLSKEKHLERFYQCLRKFALSS